MRVVRKAVIAEAIQWRGDNLSEVVDFVDKNRVRQELPLVVDMGLLDGEMEIAVTNWIIKIAANRFLSYSDEAFQATYQEI